MASTWRELLPHYVAMFLFYVVGIALVYGLTGGSNFWISLGVAAVVALGYPPVVRRAGIAPDSWSR
ncbi:hypothetical protein [Halalkalicoccus salilacus]|uniref:hypothetical protein n=1 Tax=Halalkalicoccus salilacus TaxID=3117459 RepID=UPI00300F18FC